MRRITPASGPKRYSYRRTLIRLNYRRNADRT